MIEFVHQAFICHPMCFKTETQRHCSEIVFMNSAIYFLLTKWQSYLTFTTYKVFAI